MHRHPLIFAFFLRGGGCLCRYFDFFLRGSNFIDVVHRGVCTLNGMARGPMLNETIWY